MSLFATSTVYPNFPGQVMMANEKVNEDEAEAILSNLKMEGRNSTNGLGVVGFGCDQLGLFLKGASRKS